MFKNIIYLFLIFSVSFPSFVNAEPAAASNDILDNNLNDQQTLRLFKSEYATLKKIQQEQLRQKKEQDAEKFYEQAMSFYHQKQYSQAKEAFEKVDAIIEDFKGSQAYLNRIQEKMEQQQKQELLDRRKRLEDQQKQELLQKQKDLEQRRQEEVLRKKMEIEQKKQQENFPQKQELSSKQSKIEIQQNPKEQSKSQSGSILTAEQQAQEARILAELAERSSRLYHDIADSLDDKNILLAKRKLANLQKLLNNLSDEKNKDLMSVRVEEQRRLEQEQQEKDQIRRIQAQKSYDEAIQLLREQNFDEAKKKFQEVASAYPNFKSTNSYLNQIDEDKQKVGQRALLEKTQQEEKMAQEELLRKQEEEKRQREEQKKQDQEQSVFLTQRALTLNDEIIALTKSKDYLSARTKLEELEKVMAQLKVVGESILRSKEEENFNRMRIKQSKQEDHQKQKLIREQEVVEGQQTHRTKKSRKKVVLEVKEAEFLKQKAERERQEEVFGQALELYRSRKYTAARVIFAELLSKGDSRANSYLRKIDRLIHKDVVESHVFENRQRSDFLKEKRRQQKISNIAVSQEREHRLRITQEQERQRKIFDHQQQEERRRIQALRMEEKEWQRLENKRQQMESKNQEQKEEYRFRRINPVSKNEAEIDKSSKDSQVGFTKVKLISDQKDQETHKDVEDQNLKNNEKVEGVKEVEKKDLKEEARKKKMEERRKKIQDQKEKKEQELRAIEENQKKQSKQVIEQKKEVHDKKEDLRKKILEDKEIKKQELKNEADARRKQLEEINQQKEEIRIKREEDRQKKIQEQQEEKERMRKEAEDLRKQREEVRQKEMEMRRGEAERQEKERLEQQRKAQQLLLEQKQREQLERTAQEHQQRLERERKEIRLQLESGVQSIYEEALKLYKSGHYAAAAQRFSDVKDLIPNYKNTEELFEKSQKHANDRQSLPVTPVKIGVSQSTTAPAQKDNISKTLDLFENL